MLLMKTILPISTFLLVAYTSFSFSQVLNTKHLEEPLLQEGQCHTYTSAKVYLKDISERAREEIGIEKNSSIKNTQTESFFFCKIKCHLNSQETSMWITRKDHNENFKNMSGFVCPGLNIQDVALSPTLTIKTTVATPYSAVQSDFPEVHAYLKSTSYKLKGTLASQLVLEFYRTLNIVRTSYAMANSSVFQDASVLLGRYSPEKPDAWTAAKQKVLQLQSENVQRKGSLLDFKSGEDLVDLFFLMNGRFLLYID